MATSFVEIHGCVATAITYPYFYDSLQFHNAKDLQEHTEAKFAAQELPADPDEVDLESAAEAPAAPTTRSAPRARG